LVKRFRVPFAVFKMLGVPCESMLLLLTLAVIVDSWRDIGHGDKRPHTCGKAWVVYRK